MKHKRTLIFSAALIMALAAVFNPANLFAQRGSRASETLEIRLASPLPENSAWGNALKRLAAEWARITNNEVRIRILHNGMEGGEEKMFSSLSSNNIQAALFTSFGLSAISPAIMTMSVPFNINNDAELNAVFSEIEPFLDTQASRTNFHILAYSKAGWVNIFSKEPVFVPDDLKRLRLASNPEAEQMNNAFRTMGFTVVESDWNDVGTKLTTGSVNSIYQISPVVAAYRFDDAGLKHMMSMPIAPVIGGLAINRVTWNKINPSYQQELMRVTRRFAADLDNSMPQTAKDADTALVRRGLRINQLNSAQEAQWASEMQRAMPSLIGTTFDSDIYQRINGILERHRSGGR